MDWDPDISFDALMARVSSNVRASTSRPGGDAGDLSWDLAKIPQLFDALLPPPGSDRWGSSAMAWVIAAILRYCDEEGAPVTPDVFGSALAGFQRVFSREPLEGTSPAGGFPRAFEEHLRDRSDSVVTWACWTAYCICAGHVSGGGSAQRGSADRTKWPADMTTSRPSTRSSSLSLLHAMVCCHVPRPHHAGYDDFDQLMMFLGGSLRLLDASTPRTSFARWYSGQCAQRCLSLASGMQVTRDEQLAALHALADATEGMKRAERTKWEFILAATSALTRAGGLILSPEAAVEVLRVLSFSTRRFGSTYRSLIQSLMAVYKEMPAHADLVLDRWELFDPRVALAVLLPGCHSLSASTITSKLAPRCLNLLQECHRNAVQADGDGSSGLLQLLQDVRVGALPPILDAYRLFVDEKSIRILHTVAIPHLCSLAARSPARSISTAF